MRLPVTLLYPDERRRDTLVRYHEIDRQQHVTLAVSGLGRRPGKELDRLLSEGRIEEALESMRQSGSEGVAVLGRRQRDAWQLTLHVVGRQQASAFLIPLAGRPEWVDAREPINLERGSHLLVPVLSSGEEAVSGLVRSLGGLPRDLQLLLLETLRDPGLEERLERLERSAGLVRSGPPPVRGRWWDRAWDKTRHWISRPVSTGLFLSLLLPLLLVGGWFVSRQVQSVAPASQSQEGRATGGDEPGPGGGDLDGSSVDGSDPATSAAATSLEPQVGYEQLLAALDQSDHPRMVELRRGHRGDGAAPSVVDSSSAWMVLKLVANRLGAGLEGRDWDSDDYLAATKTFFVETSPGFSDEETAAVAWVTCRAWDFPGIPIGMSRPRNLALQLLSSCQELDDAAQRAAAEGLHRLAAHVRDLDGGDGGPAGGDGEVARQGGSP